METIKINPLKNKCIPNLLSTWAIGGWMWGGTDEQESIKTIHLALDSGVNIIDTAPVYGFGVSEEIVGKALQQYGKRDNIVISTKVGLEWENQKVHRNASTIRIKQEIEDSLNVLTPTILIFIKFIGLIPRSIEETAEAMLALFTEGKNSGYRC